MSDLQNETGAVSAGRLDADAQRATQELIQQMAKQIVDQLGSRLSQLDVQVANLADAIKDMRGDIKGLQRNVEDLSDRADRQDKRLAAIETLPPIPMSQPSRYYATEAHSVSLAQRVRLSHLG